MIQYRREDAEMLEFLVNAVLLWGLAIMLCGAALIVMDKEEEYQQRKKDNDK